MLTQGLNLGLDFEGGDAWDIPASETFGVDEAADVLIANDVSTSGARIQLRSSETSDVVTVQVKELPRDQAAAVTAGFAEAAGVTVNEISFSFTSSTWGAEITDKAIRALVIFLLVVALFISVRFEWRMALAAIAAMVNDVIVAVGVYSVFQFEVTPATVIAFLTILGYSLYDTIVVFDRVKENEGRYATTKMPYEDIVNISMNQVMVRSLLTSFSSILPGDLAVAVGCWGHGCRLAARVRAGTAGRHDLGCVLLDLHCDAAARLPEVEEGDQVATSATARRRTARRSHGVRNHRTDLRPTLRIPTRSTATPMVASRCTVGATAPVQADRLLSHPPRPRKKKRR